MNPINIFWGLVFMLPLASHANRHTGMLKPSETPAPAAQHSYFDAERRELICREPIPIVRLTLKADSTATVAPALCHCIWHHFPADGWERATASSIRLNKYTDLRLAEFIPRRATLLKVFVRFRLKGKPTFLAWNGV